MQITFRIASEADASPIAALVNKAYRPAPQLRGWTHEADLVAGARTSAAQVRSLFRSGSFVLVLCVDGTIVACVHLEVSAACASIGMLATEPAYQAQGLGKQMLSHAEQYGARHCRASVFKMSVLSSRPELIAFYERRGYVRTGALEDYPLCAGVGQPVVEGLQLETLLKSYLVAAPEIR